MPIPKVLIVNDNATALYAMASVLTAANELNTYEVVKATSGEDALRQVLLHDFAVILLDVKMPGMDGFETAEAIQSRPASAHVPIIFVTAHFADEMRRLEAYKTGAVDYLFTPVIPQILQTKVSVFVELAKRKIELQDKTEALAKLNDDLRVQRLHDLEQLNAELQAEIVERKRAEQRAQEMATRDPLTGLLNRRSLMEQLHLAIAESARRHEEIGVLFLDLDKFKAINDNFGHAAGDNFLMQVAARIRKSVRETDLVARLGGDEFVVVLKDCMTPAKARQIADNIGRAIAQPYLMGEQLLASSASIGVAVYPQDGATADALMKCADLAMYAAKQTRHAAFPSTHMQCTVLQ